MLSFFIALGIVTSVLVAAAPAGAAPRTLATGQFANVFAETQSVQINLGPGDAATVVLQDSAGAHVAQKDMPAAVDSTVVNFGDHPPGYYEVVVGETRLPLVVVIDPARRVPGESRLATDNAMSWLEKPEQFEGLADVLRLAGFVWVRERLSWGEVEPTRGKFDWGRYDTSASVLARHGIHVYDIFHASPAWSRADRDTKAPPDDLRDIYQFAQELARKFNGRIQTWEVWNEPDIDFFSQPASELAAFQKAAFLGFRSVDPHPQVLGPSMAMGAGSFADDLLTNGAGHYMDVWNYHIYADPSAYASRSEGFRKLLARHGIDLPFWVTEAGDAVQGPGGVLTRESRFHQAAFISRAYPQALAAGIDRHFFFVFPFYKEGQTGWGVFEPGQKAPFPGLAALSTSTYALGRGDFLGRLDVPGSAARVLAFARDNDTAALVVWREADAPADVALPLQWDAVREARNYLGSPLQAAQGPVTLSVGRAADYLVVARTALAGKLTAPSPPAAISREPGPELMDVVVRLRPGVGKVHKDADGWVVPTGVSVPVSAEIYNFAKKDFNGELHLDAQGGWQPDQSHVPLIVAAGGRAVIPIKLTSPGGMGRGSLRAAAQEGKAMTSPAIIRLQGDPDEAPATGSRALDILSNPESWLKNIAGHGSMEIAPIDGGGVRFLFTFRTAGDNWAYPQVLFSPVLDLKGYTALRFEYRTSVADSGPVRVMVVESGGSSYMTGAGLPGSTEWKQATVVFSDLTLMFDSPPDPDGQLDLDRITTIRIGANCKHQALTLEIRNVQAVKL